MGWSASQYIKFEQERTRPAFELMARIPPTTFHRIIDLGCGPGNSTQLLLERFQNTVISGVDSDDTMLEEARRRLPEISFTKADLAFWQPDEPVDLLFANAVFQWLPHHLPLLSRFMDILNPGGVLAIQMPDNMNEPTHRLMKDISCQGPWKTAFENNPVERQSLPSPIDYYNQLIAQSSRVDLWHTIYYHPLPDIAAIIEWVKGTGLLPYLSRLEKHEHTAFLKDYSQRLEDAYPKMSDGTVLLRFPRFFLVAIKD